MTYTIQEVPGVAFSETLSNLNSLVKEWPPLTERHFEKGYWWLAFRGGEVAAFAGLAPMEPFVGVGYLKRCLVLPGHYGRGLQYRFMCAREAKAKQLGWTHLVSECLESNSYSSANFRKAGFSRCDPEQPWAKDSVYWMKVLA